MSINNFSPKQALVILAILATMLTMNATALTNVAAFYQDGDWSEPLLLFEGVTDPIVVADSAGDLHLVYTEVAEENSESTGLAIYYASRSDGRWNQPVDILYSPGGQVSLSGMVVDGQGRLNVAWGDDANLYLSTAHISRTDNASNWNTDTIEVGQLPIGDLVLDGRGRMHLAVRINFFTIVYLYSDDGGESWSAPLSVDRVLEQEDFAFGRPHMAVDSEGTLHMTWYRTAREVDWNDWSVWYGRSSDDGVSWQVSELATPEFGNSEVIVDSDNNVHLVYGRKISHPDGRWHRWSGDGGATWSEPRPLYPGVEHASGQTGGSDFSFDGDGQLHLVNSYGGKNGDVSAWHLVWQGQRWSEPELLMDTRYHAHFPRIASSLGNQLSFFAGSNRVADHGLFERSITVDAQPIAAEAIPPLRTLQTGEETLSGDQGLATPLLPAPGISLPEEARAAPPNKTPFNSLLIGAGASALLVLVVVLLHRRSSGRRW